MRPLPYRVFLWVFSFSNAVVWFFLLCGLGVFVHGHLAEAGVLSRGAAVRFFAAAIVLPIALALQGAIVNLRAQFLIGRFLAPAERGPLEPVRNPWLVAVPFAVGLCAVAVPILVGALMILLPAELNARGTPLLIGGVGAVLVFGAVVRVADREFRHYLQAIDRPPAAPMLLATYLLRNIALPWALINLLINAVLAWITYGQGPWLASGTVSMIDLRLDLTVMALLISICMALSALPEAETDFRRGLVRLPVAMPSMPRLWTRYIYALLVAFGMYSLVTAAARALSVSEIPLCGVIVLKGLCAAVVAGAAAGLCALWALGRCVRRRAAAFPVKVITASVVST